MCVKSYLFSTFSLGIGALQMSTIVILYFDWQALNFMLQKIFCGADEVQRREGSQSRSCQKYRVYNYNMCEKYLELHQLLDQIYCETKGYLFQLYAGMCFFSTGPLSQASTTLKQRSVPVPSCHWSTTSPSCMVPMMPSTWQKSLGLFTLQTALFTKAEVCCGCVKTCLVL